MAPTNALISYATGSFPTVTGVASVNSTGPVTCNDCYSLQINSGGAVLPNPATQCYGQSWCANWAQFVALVDDGPGGGRFLRMEKWLYFLTNFCPTGWAYGGANACYWNSRSAVLPMIPITALSSVRMTGVADAVAGDSVFLTVGQTMYALRDILPVNATQLATTWTAAQFNVLGLIAGDEANFNSGSTITVQLATNNGVATSPTCAPDAPPYQGTGESNNLTKVSPPQNPLPELNPSIVYTESNVPGGTGSCATLPAITPALSQ